MDEEVLQLLKQYQSGDETAAAVIFRRYVSQLIGLVQRRMSAKLARRMDPDDIVQSAFRSFFLKARDGKFTFDSDTELWHLLAVITLKKVHKKVEFHTAAKRGMDREQDLEGSANRALRDGVTSQPSPEDELLLLEEIDELGAGLDDIQTRMLELRLQGYALEEIAEQVQRSERTVRRVLDCVKARLQERLLEER